MPILEEPGFDVELPELTECCICVTPHSVARVKQHHTNVLPVSHHAQAVHSKTILFFVLEEPWLACCPWCTRRQTSVLCIFVLFHTQAVHGKPGLVSSGGALARLLPLVYTQTVIRADMIRTVDLGPFKHKVRVWCGDDGGVLTGSVCDCGPPPRQQVQVLFKQS